MIITSKVIFFILLKKKSNTSYQNYNNYSFYITSVDNHTNNVYKHRHKKREREQSFVIDIECIEYDSVSVFEHGGERTCLSLYSSQKLYCIVIRISITMKRL